MSPSQVAVRRLGLAVRYGDTAAERAARQDVLAAKVAAFLTKAIKDQPPLRLEQRQALAAQILAASAG